MLDDVLREAGTNISDVDLIAVTTGPGAFTGLRIGLAMARGMALARNVPCHGVTTMQAVAHGIDASLREGLPLVIVLESKRSDVYVQFFTETLQESGPPKAMDLNTLADEIETSGTRYFLAGDANERTVRELGDLVLPIDGYGIPDAAVVARLADEHRMSGGGPASPDPLYLRPPDAKPAKDSGGLRPPLGSGTL